MDPLCEKSYNVSPYVYCHSNPVKRIDPDGKDDFELQKNGQLILRNVGGEIDNIYYGKNSFSIAHGAFGKTTKNMCIILMCLTGARFLSRRIVR